MALRAKLKIDGNNYTYDVQDMDYRLFKPTAAEGIGVKPEAKTTGGTINCTILANNKDNSFFQGWVSKLAEKYSGEFTLPVIHGVIHETVTVTFKNAFCIDLQVTYSSFTSKQVLLRITIAPTEITFNPGNVTFKNEKLKTPEDGESSPTKGEKTGEPTPPKNFLLLGDQKLTLNL